jgi:RimJ/RimL family protein N-acetyltransferase
VGLQLLIGRFEPGRLGVSHEQRRRAVRLRAVKETDLPIFFVYQRDPDALFLSGFTPRNYETFIEHWQGLLANPRVLSRTILAGDALAGNVLSFDYQGRREVGYWLGREFWGKGIASAALATFLGIEPTRPLFGAVATHNAASFRLLQKCGFRPRSELDEAGATAGIRRLMFELAAPLQPG